MNAQSLAARRERLIERSGRLRAELKRDAAALSDRFQTFDRLAAFAASPWTRTLAAAGAALLLFRRPRRLMRLALRLAPLYPSLRPLVERWMRGWRGRRREKAEASAGVNPPP